MSSPMARIKPRGKLKQASRSTKKTLTMSLEKVSEMLKKQKRVEGMVHGQSMPRQDIVETLVQRQHLAELHNLMTQLPAGEIASILEALPVEDAQLLWKQIPPGRENDVLWEVSDACR